uniref:Zinc finger, CCHC-type n=1 Tax=Tanacetum cinerariifolium TaxID=118510 RepID=A0A6L2N332_TANCI|nr:zinc finger, CCHC-type [Tanacetum cinerariifolium]
MSSDLFLRIVNDILSYTANPLPQHFYFFTSRLDCTGRMSISTLMKCTAAIRRFTYGGTADAFDEYLQMSEHTARDALFFFNMCIIELYMPKYLRKPTSEDVVNIQQKHNNVHGFPGMLESFDCMHWEWKNCLVSSQAPVVPYVVNGVEYRNGYYLADEIYLEWASLVKSFTVATDPKHTYFKQRQESARKDVERAFGVLQGRWGLIQQPTRAYEDNTLRRIMYAGIIMHSMILEDQNMLIVDLNYVYSNPARGFYENKEVSGVIWCYDYRSGVGVGDVLMWRRRGDGKNATMEQIRRRNKWENEHYVCRSSMEPLFLLPSSPKTTFDLHVEAKYMAKDASSMKFFVSNFKNYKMIDSRPVMEQYNELFGILGRFTQHKMNMDEAIQVSCIIVKLSPSLKEFKHTLKHKKEELTLVELESHLNIDESLRVQDSNKPKSNNVVGPSVVNVVEHKESTMYNDNKSKRKHHDTKDDPNKKSKGAWWLLGSSGKDDGSGVRGSGVEQEVGKRDI